MNSQFKKGVLELVVLIVVSKKEIYGYEIVKRVCEVVHVNEGTIYPLLKRLTNEKYVDTYLQESSEGPPRKYYQLTELGRLQMLDLKREWIAFSHQIQKFLEQGEQEYE